MVREVREVREGGEIHWCMFGHAFSPTDPSVLMYRQC